LTAQASAIPDTAFVVGHSNGGIVAREANREGGRNWQALVTVGTPHQGAEFANSVLDGLLGSYVVYLTDATAAPVWYYSQFYEDPQYWDSFSSVAALWNEFGSYIPAFAAAVGFGVTDLLSQMVPGSGFLQTLNGSANQSRESAAIPNRIAIVSSLDDNNGVIFRALFSAAAASIDRDARSVAIGVFLSAGTYYEFYDDYSDPYMQDKIDNADLWFSAADALGYMDSDWCRLIGAGPYCLPNDGIVPASSQVAPNTNRTIFIQNASHTEETKADVTYFALHGLFAVGGPLTIPVIGSGNNGGLSIGGIDGPPYIYPGDSPVFTANVGGGQTPYSYTWTVNGTVVQTGSSGSLSFFATSDFEVGVVVTDAAGAQVSATLDVMYEGCGQIIGCGGPQ
jgi:pimeloyl-ACP methyl ester carboxylesterase